MPLLVTIQKAPDSAILKETSKTFVNEGGTIGRGQNNNWVLDDPARFLSNTHCEILYEDGQFYIIDHSTNGTFYNGSSEPIGKGEKIPVHNNDSFILGDYEFSIAETDSAFDAGTAADVYASDPFGSDAQPHPAMDDDIFSKPLPNDGIVPGSGSNSNSLVENGSSELDPLAALNKVQGISEDQNPDFHIGTDADPFASATHSDQIDPLNQQISWPKSSPEQNFGGEGAIPDDWDDDLLSPPGDAQVNLSASFGAAKPGTSSAKFPAKPVASDRGDAAAAHPVKPGLADRSFIHALGLDDKNLSDADIARINQLAGEVFREMINGLMLILGSRNTIKNEFRMNVTTIQPKENNPLKFSANVGDALDKMFLKDGDAYQKPVEAVRDGFDSIAEHQLAILAGIREAFKGVIERFEPEFLEEHFAKHHKGAVLPVSQKARNWEYYVEYYNDLASDFDKSFKFLYGDGFVRAYEDQLKMLSISRKSKDG